MKRFLKWTALIVVGIIVLFILIGLLLPTDYELSRKTVIKATPAKVHEKVGDLKQWDVWGPWKDEDPTIVVRLGEKTQGVGASQSWKGESGDGSMVFTAVSPETGVKYDLSFYEGAQKCRGWIAYEARGEQTEVTWGMSGSTSPPIGGYFVLMMDSMVGPMFEKGLAKLKKAVEAGGQ